MSTDKAPYRYGDTVQIAPADKIRPSLYHMAGQQGTVLAYAPHASASILVQPLYAGEAWLLPHEVIVVEPNR